MKNRRMNERQSHGQWEDEKEGNQIQKQLEVGKEGQLSNVKEKTGQCFKEEGWSTMLSTSDRLGAINQSLGIWQHL